MRGIEFSEEFSVDVKSDATLIELLEQGNYRFKHGSINEKNFPFSIKTDKNNHRLFLCYLQFDEGPKEPDEEFVRSVINSQGLKPANIQELMYFNKKYELFLDMYKVVALGSIYRPQTKEGLDTTIYSSYGNYVGRSEMSGKYLDIIWTDLICVGENIAILATPNC
jgi:hypothetical protein